MFTNIQAKNFRGFSELNIELGTVNLFFGPNNSGKSSILSALNILTQTLRSRDQAIQLLLNGEREELGTWEDVSHLNKVSNKISLRIGIDSDALRPLERKRIRGSVELEYKYHPKIKRIALLRTQLNMENPERSLRVYRAAGGTYAFEADLGNGKGFWGDKRFVQLYYFMPQIRMSAALSKKNKKEEQNAIRNFNLFTVALLEELLGIEYIGPLRDFPRRTYLFAGETPQFVGAKGERAVDLLVADLGRKKRERRNILPKVSRWFRKSRIARELAIKPLTTRHYELRLRHGVSKERENIADVGFGCSQVLPVLVGGYNLQGTGTIMVQQPELHLHPRAQAELGDFFVDLGNRGTQSIIETHSEHLLLRIQSLVAEGAISHSKVRIYYVGSSPGSGSKRVTEIRLNGRGAFEDEWPDGFFPERMNESIRMAKARQAGN